MTATFIMLPHEVYDSAAFTTLRPIDIAVLVLLIRKHNGRNNGDIALGTREIATRCKCGQTTAVRAMKNLQASGLVSLVHKGHIVPEIGRENISSRWRLNFVTEGAPKTVQRGAPEKVQQPVPPLNRHRSNSQRTATGAVYRQSYQGKAQHAGMPGIRTKP